MFKQSIKKRRYSFSLVFVLSFASLTSLAQETLNDLTQEIQIAAKHNSANLRSKVATYKENVVITQGNIKITADEATVYSDLKTDKKTYVLNGKPVKFERIEEDGFLVSAQANIMQYKPGIRLLSVEGDARLQEKRSLVKGDKIRYNLETKEVYAKGKPVAFHRTLTDGTPIDILGNDVSYVPESRLVSVEGNAVVRQIGTEVKGSKMTYNVDTEQLNVDSNSDETVTTIIQPKLNKENQ